MIYVPYEIEGFQGTQGGSASGYGRGRAVLTLLAYATSNAQIDAEAAMKRLCRPGMRCANVLVRSVEPSTLSRLRVRAASNASKMPSLSKRIASADRKSSNPLVASADAAAATAKWHRLRQSEPSNPGVLLSIATDLLDKEGKNWFHGAARCFAVFAARQNRKSRDMLWSRLCASDMSDIFLGGTQRQHGSEPELPICCERYAEIVKEMSRSRALSPYHRSFICLSLLRRAKPAHWKRATSTVKHEIRRELEIEPTHHVLFFAAVLCWRAGEAAQAAEHLDDMGGVDGMRSSGLPDILWQPSEEGHARATRRIQSWLWPNLLVVMDIYGRAGRWDEVLKAFQAISSASNTADAGLDCGSAGVSHRDAASQDRESLAVEPDMTAMTAGTEADRPRVPLHPGPLAYAVTAGINLVKVDAAAVALAHMLDSLRSHRAAAVAATTTLAGTPPTPDAVGGASAGGGGKYSENIGARPLSESEATVTCSTGGDIGDRKVYVEESLGIQWLDATVRGFARADRWDLAIAALSPAVCEWVSVGCHAQRVGDMMEGGDGRRGIQQLRLLLAPFFERNLNAIPATPKEVEGATACLEALQTAMNLANTGIPLDGSSGYASVDARRSLNVEVEATEGKQLDTSESIPGQPWEGRSAAECLRAKRREELVYAEALRCLSFADVEHNASWVARVSSNAVFLKPPRHLVSPPPSADPDGDSGSVRRATDELIRSCIVDLPAATVLDAVRLAWESNECHGEIRDVGRHAALRLYEAGVHAGTLAAGLPWVSATAGVVDLSTECFFSHEEIGVGALNVVLSDMLRRHAYDEEVTGHVHHPGADLIVIVGLDIDDTALSALRAILWLLDSEYSCLGQRSALSPPEILGVASSRATPKARRNSEEAFQYEKQLLNRPRKNGIVLCLPRLRLQTWLLATGRARRGAGRDERSTAWTPEWMELEVDPLPELSTAVQTAGRETESLPRTRGSGCCG